MSGKTLISELQNQGVQFTSIPEGRTPIGQLSNPPQPTQNFGEGRMGEQVRRPIDNVTLLQEPQPQVQEPQPIEPQPIDVSFEENQEITEKKNPTINIAGLTLDIDSTLAISFGIFVWIYVWIATGLLSKARQNFIYLVIFSLFIIYSMINIITSGTSSGGAVYELNILLTVEQMISILFGTLVVLTLFSEKFPTHPETKRLVLRVLIVCLMLLSLASMWLNVVTSGRSFRAIRKTKQSLYNISLALVITIGILLFNSSTPMSEIMIAQ